MLDPVVTEIPLVPTPLLGAERVGATGRPPIQPVAPPPDMDLGATTTDTDEVW